MGKIYFINNIVDKSLKEKFSYSVAANNWQKNFYKNLSHIAKERVIGITIIFSRIYPLGKCIIPWLYYKDKNKNGLFYINFILIRGITIFISLLYFFIKNIRKNDKIIIYNINLPIILPIILIKKFINIKLIVIVADIFVNNENKENKIREIIDKFSFIIQKILIKKIDVIIAVNKLILEDFKINNGVVLGGGVNREDKKEKFDIKLKKKKKVIFAGRIDHLNGIDFLLDAFDYIKNKNIELYIYGKGPLLELVKIKEKINPNVHYGGYIEEQEMMNELIKGDLLIIPRRKTLKTLRYTFPSKLYEYLLSGTPVLITNIPGLEDDFKKYLYVKDTENPEVLMAEIEEILSISSEKLNLKGKLAQNFILKEKNWKKEVKRVYNSVIK